MVRKLVLLIVLLNGFLLKAQNSIDIDDIFKMQLFLDKKNTVHKSTKNVVKNNALYRAFEESIELNMDTLKVESKLYEFIDPFKYYKIDLKNITQKLSNKDFQIQSLGLTSGKCEEYILAINSKKGLVYRLSGFNGNDFLIYLQDFKDIYYKNTDNKLSMGKFIRNYKLPDVDFKCLYKGLRAKNINRKKHPCLVRCSDPVQIE